MDADGRPERGYSAGQAWIPGDAAPDFASQETDPYRPPAGARGGPPPSPPPMSRRKLIMLATAPLTALLLMVAVLLPPQMVVLQAGPTYDVLGADAGPLLTVEGAPEYPSDGELRITTVSLVNLADYAGTIGEAVRSWFDPSLGVVPTDSVFLTTPEEEGAISAQDFITSQERATVSALELLDYEVPMTITIVDTFEESGAVGLVEAGDAIVAADGTAVVSFSDLSDAVGARSPGEPITLTLDRAGTRMDVTFDTIEGPDGAAILGVWVDPEFELPVDVAVAIDSVGGPSAGLIFALAIVETLTEVDEAGDKDVAGTGTIDLRGEVGQIGGVRFKMIGARRDGAEWFLAPTSNCDEIVGYVPEGLQVVAVDTLDEAYAALIAIGEGATAALPTCESLR